MNYRYLVNIDSLTSKKYINNSKFLKNNILLRSYHQNIHYKYVSHSEWQILKNQGYDIEIKREYDEETNIVDEYPRFVTFNLHIDNIVINKVHQCNSNLRVNDIIGVLFSAQDYIVKSNDQVIDSTLKFNNFDDILCLDIYCQQVCGLANLGNTCFMNSALQCVYNLDNFRLHILSYNYKGEITNALKNLFGEMGIKKFYTPREFRNSFGRTNNQFMDYNQHDAEEFMRALLNSVDDEIKKDLQTRKMDVDEKEKGDEQEKVIEIEKDNEKGKVHEKMDETQSDKCKDDFECTESKSIENIANNSMDRVSFESQDKYIEEIEDSNTKSKESNYSNLHAMNGGSKESKEMQNNREIQSSRECENEIKHKRIETTSNTKKYSNTSKSDTKRNLRKIESVPQTDTNSDEKPTNVKTVIDDLFKGVTMSTQSCLSCNTSSTVTEPFLFLSLPIPTEKVVHSKAYLVRNGFIEKLLTPRTITVKCLKYKLKDLGIENVMIISTNNERRILLRDIDCISTYENIICYEYNPSNVYFWLILRKTKYSILRDFFFFHMLIELSNFESILSQVKKNLEFFGDYDSIDNFNTKISKEIINNIHKTSLINRERHLLTSQPDSRIYDLDPSISFHRTIQEITVEAQDHNTLFTKIQHNINLNDCLDLYFTKEYLLNGDKYGCLECKKVTEHSKAIRLCSLPKFFIIHLSRFSFYKKSKKVNNFIDFPLVLTHTILQKYFGVNSEVRDYELVCVSNHLNLCSMSGHYTAYVWRKNKWWLINDGVVTEVNEIKKDDAYILFYRAKDI